MRSRLLGLLLCAALGCGPSASRSLICRHASPLQGAVRFKVTAQWEVIEGGFFLLTLAIDEAPPPQRIRAGAQRYVLWLVQPDPVEGERAPLRIGALTYEEEAQAIRAAFVLPAAANLDAGAGALLITAEAQPAPSRPQEAWAEISLSRGEIAGCQPGEIITSYR